MFKGSITALITPFKNGEVDEEGFQSFVDWQINEGTHGVVPVGTTGESPTLNHDEHKRVVELCIDVAKGRVPVIAGAGSNSTEEAVDFTKHAKAAGADGVLQVCPYYNKPTQEGLYLHFKEIAECADIPVIIYNIPGRSVVDMSNETMAKLSKLPNIAGVKDATCDLARPLNSRLECEEGFVQLSGEDATIGAFLGQGGDGCISVTSNVAPKLCSEMHEAWQARDLDGFAERRDRLAPLHDALFCETSPAPVKYAAHLLGKSDPKCRLPIAPLSEQGQETVRKAMVKVGLIN